MVKVMRILIWTTYAEHNVLCVGLQGYPNREFIIHYVKYRLLFQKILVESLPLTLSFFPNLRVPKL